MGKNLEALNLHSTAKITKSTNTLEVGAFYLKLVCDTAITPLEHSLGQIKSYAHIDIFLYFIFLLFTKNLNLNIF